MISIDEEDVGGITEFGSSAGRRSTWAGRIGPTRSEDYDYEM